MKIKTILFLTTLVVTSNVHAKNWSKYKFKKFNFTAGSWTENYGNVQSNQKGDVNGFEFNPYIGIGGEYHLKKRHHIIPEIGYVLEKKVNEAKKNLLFARLDYGHLVNSWFRLRIGTSFLYQIISGDGGEKTLPNGNETETYFIPSERRTSLNQTLDFATEFLLDDISFKLQTYTYAFNLENERMTSVSLSVNYRMKLWGRK